MRELIDGQLVDGFERELFQAALANLDAANNPLRFNNFSYAMRELVRHVLARLAPDEEVLNCSWYKNETENQNGISRKQRVFYAVHGGLTRSYVQDELGLDLEDIHRTLRDTVNELSKYTHIQPAIFNVDDDKVLELVDETMSAVVYLFDIMDESRHLLLNALRYHIERSIFEAAVGETILSIDELASHHSIEIVFTDEVEVAEICSRFVTFLASGELVCELQWGSGGDQRRGDGAVSSESFPFTCVLKGPVQNPSAIQVDEHALDVDTSSWFE
ncbi:hypothetical protein [Oceanibacterium hippocampi]|uniref:Uncharacterized protein n=1 Tax=Oceanibacterium hippocampi TaxID=745714 RepID=A0A1Y5T532_9PROT|nr:hypothetical protein [Oceanibacterium hippocampi]SLN56127.1 hypothetical protein OCH7691_02423 [Oceanibacterium hippocampi]